MRKGRVAVNSFRQKGRDAATGTSSVDPRIPVYLIVGDSGTAKSCLVQRIVDSNTQCEPAAFVAMDRASWQIASRYTEPISAEPMIIRAATGHICIDGGADPVDAIYQLHLRKLGLLKPQLDYETLVLEVAGGVDVGGFVAVVQNDTRLDVTYRIAGILHAVDARENTIPFDERQEHYVGLADIVLVTNAARHRSHDYSATTDKISSVNPFASIRDFGDFKLREIDSGRRSDHFCAVRPNRKERQRPYGTVALRRTGSSSRVIASNLYNARHRNMAPESPPVRGLKMSMPGSVDIMDFMAVVKGLSETLGRDLLRMTAALSVRNVDHAVAIDVIGGTLLHPSFHDCGGAEQSVFCLIARGLDIERTVSSIEDCAVDGVHMKARLEAAI